MSDYINGPVLAASLDELRYLVFRGMTGETGQSAYELAVSLGFEGTEAEWIASLHGTDGRDGTDGKSLRVNSSGHVEYWDDTTQQWVDTGIEATGPEGPAGTDGYTPTISMQSVDGGYIMTISDGRPNGTVRSYTILNGADGTPGEDGGGFELPEGGEAGQALISDGEDGAEWGKAQGSADLGTDIEPMPASEVRENLDFAQMYGGEGNTLWGFYAVQDDPTNAQGGKNIYVVPVKANTKYTIIPNSTGKAVFCTAYSFDSPPEGVKPEIVYKPSFTGSIDLAGRQSTSLNIRTTKYRFTPSTDGYIVGAWYNSVGALVYEGESPNKAWEAFLDYPNNDLTLNDAPLYSATNPKINSENFLHGIKPNDKIKRLIRLGDYYKDIIGSSFKLVCIGDSITFGSSVGAGNRYIDFLQKKLGIGLAAWSQNGATITTGYGMQWSSGNTSYGTGVDGLIARNMSKSLDWTDGSFDVFKAMTEHKVFTIALGTNDWIYNAPLGSYSDSIETASFYGCYKKLIAKIREMYPDSAIILICPWQQYYNNIHWYEQNEAGCSVKTYAMAIHEIAMMTRNAWVLDMLNNPYITEMANSESGVYVDNVHIGRKAHILVAHELEKILMQVVMMNGYDYVPLVTYDDTFTGQK